MTVLQSGGMPCPPEVIPQWYGLNAGDLGLIQCFFLHICGKVTPVNVEDGAETTFCSAPEERDVPAVVDPGLHRRGCHPYGA